MYRTQNFQKLIRACCTKCIHFFFCLVSCDKTTQCDLKLLNKENEGGGMLKLSRTGLLPAVEFNGYIMCNVFKLKV